jgi:RNase P subunit RPR2
MKNIPIPLKIDDYQKKRGGFSKILILICKKCKNKVAYYQKDGNGWLKRCYVDRIYLIPDLKNPQFSLKKNFICQKCQTILGKPIIYKKESREAYEIDRQKLLRRKITQI